MELSTWEYLKYLHTASEYYHLFGVDSKRSRDECEKRETNHLKVKVIEKSYISHIQSDEFREYSVS